MESKAYPRATLIIISLKFSWKQDFNPNSYCTRRKVFLSSFDLKNNFNETGRNIQMLTTKNNENSFLPISTKNMLFGMHSA